MGYMIHWDGKYHTGSCDDLGRVIWSEDPEDAFVYSTSDKAKNVINGDDRLKNAKVEQK